MTDAREIIAEVIQDFRDAGQPINDVVLSVSDDVITALTATGFRIIGPDEASTIAEECARIAESYGPPGILQHMGTRRAVAAAIRARFGRLA